jgi:hypothetical protein
MYATRYPLRGAPRWTPYVRRTKRWIPNFSPPRVAPTFPSAEDLAEGTGTRSFAAVTTQADDYIVVEIIYESGSGTPSAPTATGLSFDLENSVEGVSPGNDVEITQYVALDAAGGSRTVQCQANGALAYRARLTVVRGSEGPANVAASSTGQTVSASTSKDASALFMAVGDWTAGSVGSPVWTPGGTTVASQQGTQGTYIFGRYDDAGSATTATTGISSPSYTTPSIAVLEMLGAPEEAGGPVEHEAQAVFNLITTILADSTSENIIAATLAQVATLIAEIAVTRPATASISATATISATVDRNAVVASSLSVTSTISASPQLEAILSFALSITDTITTSTAADRPASATLAVTETITATIERLKEIDAALSITSTLTAVSSREATASATLSITSDVTTSVLAEHSVSNTLSITATRTAAALPDHVIESSLPITAARAAAVEYSGVLQAALSISSTITSAISLSAVVESTLSITTTLTAEAAIGSVGVFPINAVLTAGSAIEGTIQSSLSITSDAVADQLVSLQTIATIPIMSNFVVDMLGLFLINGSRTANVTLIAAMTVDSAIDFDSRIIDAIWRSNGTVIAETSGESVVFINVKNSLTWRDD